MRNPPHILIVDDNPANRDIFETRLAIHGYEIYTASDGEEGLALARERLPDLILLDVMMPKMDGIEVCTHLKQDESLPFMPIILVTAKSDPKDVVAGLEAGADEYLTKPVDQTSLVARVKSMLRIKALYDQTQEQAAELSTWNETLQQKVEDQLGELERLSALKRFFSPHLAELIVTTGKTEFMESHRREITVVFCDLRGFTAFSETAEPEEIMRVLREYHQSVGPLIFQFEATLEHFAGDGLMAFFNDPMPCEDPAPRAIRMAVAMQEVAGKLVEKWSARGFDLGLGIGISLGYATLGQIGFEGRFHYGAIGSVLNLASRLCDQAEGGQILITPRVQAEAGGLAEVEDLGELTLKGFMKPVKALRVVSLNEPASEDAASAGE
ncbi:MAG: response regulator [Pseudomonadota bacterium]